MGRKKLSDEDKERIIAFWKAGKSQHEIAKREGVSPATVNRLCKGITQDNVDLVNTQVYVNKEISGKSEQEVNAIHQTVNEIQRRTEFFDDAALKGQRIANEILKVKHRESDLTLNEVESYSRITARNKETVLGKNPEIAVQVNNQVQVINPFAEESD